MVEANREVCCGNAFPPAVGMGMGSHPMFMIHRDCRNFLGKEVRYQDRFCE